MPMIDLLHPSYDLKKGLAGSRLINWQLSKLDDSSGAKSLLIAEPCQGAVLSVTPAGISGACRGQYLAPSGPSPDYGPRLYAVYGRYVLRWHLDLVNYDVIGTITDDGTPVSMTSNYFSFVVVDGHGLYYRDLTLADGNSTQLSPAALPDVPGREGTKVTPTHVTVLAQRIIINSSSTAGTWMFSELPSDDAPTVPVFGASNFYSSEAKSDPTTAVATTRGALIVLGTNSMELWGTNNNKFDPYSTITGTPSGIGTASPHTLATCGDLAFFLGSSEVGSAGVYRISGTTVDRISDKALEANISALGTSVQQSAIGWAYGWEGDIYYVLDFPAANRTWVWGSDTGTWHERLRRNLAGGSWESYPYRFGVYHNGRIWVGTNVGPQLCYLTSDTYQEWDSTIRVKELVTSPLWDELNNLQSRELTVDCETGTTSSLTQAPVMTLDVSKDGGYTFGNSKPKSLGLQGDYRKVVRWHVPGVARTFCLRLRHTGTESVTLYQGRWIYSPCNRT